MVPADRVYPQLNSFLLEIALDRRLFPVLRQQVTDAAYDHPCYTGSARTSIVEPAQLYKGGEASDVFRR